MPSIPLEIVSQCLQDEQMDLSLDVIMQRLRAHENGSVVVPVAPRTLYVTALDKAMRSGAVFEFGSLSPIVKRELGKGTLDKSVIIRYLSVNRVFMNPRAWLHRNLVGNRWVDVSSDFRMAAQLARYIHELDLPEAAGRWAAGAVLGRQQHKVFTHDPRASIELLKISLGERGAEWRVRRTGALGNLYDRLRLDRQLDTEAVFDIFKGYPVLFLELLLHVGDLRVIEKLGRPALEELLKRTPDPHWLVELVKHDPKAAVNLLRLVREIGGSDLLLKPLVKALLDRRVVDPSVLDDIVERARASSETLEILADLGGPRLRARLNLDLETGSRRVPPEQ